MSWALKIMSAGGTLARTITNATSPPVTMGAPSIEIDPPGKCVTMTLKGLQTSLSIPVRGILQYSEDGVDLFWGPVVVLPSPDSKGSGPADSDSDSLDRFTIAGGDQLVKDSVVEGYLFIAETDILLGATAEKDVATIAYELCGRYAHPALTVDIANFPDTGGMLSAFYKPECQLSDALDELAKTVATGAKWWVDATGAVHFEAS